MAAAQQKPQERLIPVHDEEGRIQFTYKRAGGLGFALSLDGGDDGGGPPAAPLLPVEEQREQAVEPAVPPRLDEDLDDFISLDGGAPASQQVCANLGRS
jgi:hypothetical protein